MEMDGEYKIAVDKQTVWLSLNNPDVLKACIPGCVELDKKTDQNFTAKVVQKIGPVKATFNGEVFLTDIKAPNSYKISGEGKGGVAGFAKGEANVMLEAASDDSTVLRYAAKAMVGGKLAQLGSRLVDSAAKKIAKEFFANFTQAVESGKKA